MKLNEELRAKPSVWIEDKVRYLGMATHGPYDWLRVSQTDTGRRCGISVLRYCT